MSIPHQVRASAAVAQEARFEGSLSVAASDRLSEAVAGGTLKADLRADAASGWPRLHGRIGGELELECQRCGKRFSLPLELTLDLRLVEREDEERALLADVDPYRVQDDRLPLRELIEEEVLLALPMLARCESCENAVQAAPQPSEPQGDAKRDNPFAALKQKLKTTNRK